MFGYCAEIDTDTGENINTINMGALRPILSTKTPAAALENIDKTNGSDASQPISAQLNPLADLR
ncbi:hypothetical protein MYA98_15665 [Salmonella sp. WGH-01]|nr:hypothetical protein MYA98_15665 [Salmonella sp. WGH-01]